jgi:hypothetical protein
VSKGLAGIISFEDLLQEKTNGSNAIKNNFLIGINLHQN